MLESSCIKHLFGYRTFVTYSNHKPFRWPLLAPLREQIFHIFSDSDRIIMLFNSKWSISQCQALSLIMMMILERQIAAKKHFGLAIELIWHADDIHLGTHFFLHFYQEPSRWDIFLPQNPRRHDNFRPWLKIHFTMLATSSTSILAFLPQNAPSQSCLVGVKFIHDNHSRGLTCHSSKMKKITEQSISRTWPWSSELYCRIARQIGKLGLLTLKLKPDFSIFNAIQLLTSLQGFIALLSFFEMRKYLVLFVKNQEIERNLTQQKRLSVLPWLKYIKCGNVAPRLENFQRSLNLFTITIHCILLMSYPSVEPTSSNKSDRIYTDYCTVFTWITGNVNLFLETLALHGNLCSTTNKDRELFLTPCRNLQEWDTTGFWTTLG